MLNFCIVNARLRFWPRSIFVWNCSRGIKYHRFLPQNCLWLICTLNKDGRLLCKKHRIFGPYSWKNTWKCFLIFFQSNVFFVRGVMKQSDKNLEIRHIQQSQYKQIGQQKVARKDKKLNFLRKLVWVCEVVCSKNSAENFKKIYCSKTKLQQLYKKPGRMLYLLKIRLKLIH